MRIGRFWKGIRAGAFACAVGAGGGVTAGTAGAETLTDALIMAYQNSGLLEQNRALLRAADEDVASAVSAVRPVIRYFANSDYALNTPQSGADRLTTTVGLTAELTLFDFGRNQLAIDAARETVMAAREGLIGVEQQVLLRAVGAYMSVRRETEFVRLRENNVRLISQELQAAQDRFEVGEVTRTDVALAESRLASARAGLAATKGALAQAREEYRAAIGQYPGALAAAPARPQTAGSLEEAQANARRNHPDVRRAQREVTVTDLNQQRIGTAKLPSLSLTGRASLDANGNRNGSVGVQIGGTLYQGGQLKSLERRGAAQRDAARAGLLVATQQVILNAGNAWASLTVAKSSIEATDRQITAADIAYSGTREEASLGARTTLDVLDAEQELLDARANRVSAETDAQIAAYNLLAAMGYLTVRHLDLGVVAYDPAEYYDAVKDAPWRGESEQGQRLDALLERLGRE